MAGKGGPEKTMAGDDSAGEGGPDALPDLEPMRRCVLVW